MEHTRRILILTDYKKILSSKFMGTVNDRYDTGFDLVKIANYFTEYSYQPEIMEFSQLDMSKNYQGYYVIYASSEEKGLFYKEYIMDILLRLSDDGAILIPNLSFFRAHHNKVFAEIMRASFSKKELREPASITLGHYDEYLGVKHKISFPCIVKTSSGSGSKGVRMALSEVELEHTLKEMMRHTYRNQEYTWIRESGNKFPGYQIKKIGKKLKGEKRCAIQDEPYRTNKVVIQKFIPGLSGDYKVLFFYGKYYVLKRENRDNDFRASGSGKFEYPEELEKIYPILEFARMVASEIKQPLISMDIAQNQEGEYLIEFQCLFFGTYTIQYSEWYFEHSNHEWKKVVEKSEVEKEYCRAIAQYIGDSR